MFLASSSRGGLSVALLIAASGLMVGCNAFRSTKMGYFESPRHDQVRQGEVVQVAMFKVKDGESEGDDPEVAGLSVILAGIALEKAIGFASDELQKHLEKVALLHEASYQGRVVIPDFKPDATYDLHIVRWVATSETNRDLVEAMRSIYRFTSKKLKSGETAVIVSAIGTDYEYNEKPKFERAAVRLAKVQEPFNFKTTLTFFTAAGENAQDTNKDGTGATEKKAEKPRLIRGQLGQAMTHERMLRLGSQAHPSSLTLTESKPETGKASNVGQDAIGFFIVDKSTQVLEIQVEISEKDPSRAAERNKAAQAALKDLTPQFIDYVKDRAGLKAEEKKE